MLQGCSLVKILSDNCFSYEEYHENYSSYVVKNINIINFEPKIDYIIVDGDKYNFDICIEFKDYVSDVPNFGLNFDMSGYKIVDQCTISHEIMNKNDFIEELHRLNSVGKNIKG